MWLFLIFIVLPLVEIGLFIKIGGLLGLWPTLVIIILLAMLGSWLVRRQGMLAFAELRSSMADLRDPSAPAANGLMILFAGMLLMVPGFFTDLLGLLLLVPPIRGRVIGALAKRVQVVSFGTPGPVRPSGPGREDVIDGEFREIDPDAPRMPPSGWTKH